MKISVNASQIKPSPMRKFHPLAAAAKEQGKTIYHLNIGQPDIPTPQAFYDAIRGFDQKTLAYAESAGMPELIDAIRGYYQGLGVELERSDILVTTGGSEALMFACQCILDPGTQVVVPEPYYPNYATYVRMAGGSICALPTCPEEGYQYAFRERLEGCITPQTRAIMISNPGNPTGVTLTREQMRMLADVVKKHDLYLISDEVYREFCYDRADGVPTMGVFEDIKDNLIIVDSVSKQFSACGARIGCVITKNKQLQMALLKFCQTRLAVATINQVGATALYGVDQTFYDECRVEYKKRRDVVVNALRAIPGVLVEQPQGAFYVMAKLPVDDTDRFQHWLLSEFDDGGETVMFAPGAPFYETPGRGIDEVRIAYILEESRLRRAMELLQKGIERYRKEVMKI